MPQQVDLWVWEGGNLLPRIHTYIHIVEFSRRARAPYDHTYDLCRRFLFWVLFLFFFIYLLTYLLIFFF